jgi:4-hydroxybenzoate polyprenyltransferase
VGGGLLLIVCSLVPAGFLAWQVLTLDANQPGNPLVRFKSNHWVGLGLTLAMLVEWGW